MVAGANDGAAAAGDGGAAAGRGAAEGSSDAGALSQLTFVHRLSENFSMVGPDAPLEARAEYRRLLRLCRNRTAQLGVRQTDLDGEEDSAKFGLVAATDGVQTLALAVQPTAARRGGAGAGDAGTPRSAGADGGDDDAEEEPAAEYGTPRASFDGLSAEQSASSHQRQCFRWWKGVPSFAGTAPAKLSEQAFTKHLQARGPPYFSHVTRSHAHGELSELIDFVDWTVTCSVSGGAAHLGAAVLLPGGVAARSRPEPGGTKSCVVSLPREVDGVPLCTEECEDRDDKQQTQPQMLTQQQQTRQLVADGLKLWCRLNQNGELETIPGAAASSCRIASSSG